MGLFRRRQPEPTDAPKDDADEIELAKPSAAQKPEAERDESWMSEDYEGQLAVDVFQDRGNVVVKSTIAGVKPQDLDISITSDMVTIRGKREQETHVEEGDFFFQECYWGGFSRSIVLPVEVKPDKAVASLKNGVLTITLPKATGQKAVNLTVKGE